MPLIHSITMKWEPFVCAELMELTDVRVLQLHPDLRLVEEHLDEVVVLLKVRKDALHDQEAMIAVAGRRDAQAESRPSHPARSRPRMS